MQQNFASADSEDLWTAVCNLETGCESDIYVKWKYSPLTFALKSYSDFMRHNPVSINCAALELWKTSWGGVTCSNTLRIP